MVDFVVIPNEGGIDPAKRAMRLVGRKVRNTRIPNRQISIWLLRWVNENFKSQGGKVGGWKPFKLGGRRLSSGQIDRNAKLLQDTGRLRQSFNPFHSRVVAGIGSDLNYSVTHDLGLPHRNLPARRLVPLSTDRDVGAAVIRIYDAHIRRALR